MYSQNILQYNSFIILKWAAGEERRKFLFFPAESLKTILLRTPHLSYRLAFFPLPPLNYLIIPLFFSSFTSHLRSRFSHRSIYIRFSHSFSNAFGFKFFMPFVLGTWAKFLWVTSLVQSFLNIKPFKKIIIPITLIVWFCFMHHSSCLFNTKKWCHLTNASFSWFYLPRLSFFKAEFFVLSTYYWIYYSQVI